MMNGRMSGTLARHLNSFSTFPWPRSKFKSSEFGLAKESAYRKFSIFDDLFINFATILQIYSKYCLLEWYTKNAGNSIGHSFLNWLSYLTMLS